MPCSVKSLRLVSAESSLLTAIGSNSLHVAIGWISCGIDNRRPLCALSESCLG
jgi:hypothetical protein